MASLIGQGVVGWVATRVLDAAVNDPTVRDLGVVAIWLAVIVVGGVVLARAIDGGPGRGGLGSVTADAGGHVGSGARLLTPGQKNDPWTSGLANTLAAQRDVLRQHYAELEKITGTPRPGTAARAEWNGYAFLRDQHREGVRLLNLPWKTTDSSIADLSTSLGRLSGTTEATLRAHGMDRQADSLEPLGPPRYLPNGYDTSSLLGHRLSVLRELTERIAALRDEQPI